MTAGRSLGILVLADLALMAGGYLLVFLNPKLAPLSLVAILLGLFIFLGLVAHARPGMVLEGPRDTELGTPQA